MLKLAGPKETQDKCLSSPGAYRIPNPCWTPGALSSWSSSWLCSPCFPSLHFSSSWTSSPAFHFHTALPTQPRSLSPCSLGPHDGPAPWSILLGMLCLLLSLPLWTLPDACGCTIPHLHNKNLRPNRTSEQPCPCFIQQSDFQLLFPLY